MVQDRDMVTETTTRKLCMLSVNTIVGEVTVTLTHVCAGSLSLTAVRLMAGSNLFIAKHHNMQHSLVPQKPDSATRAW